MKTYLFRGLQFFALLLLVVSCDDNSQQIETLTAENSELRENYQSQLLETRGVHKEVDSLHTVVNKMQSQISKMQGDMPVYNASSADEKAIEQLVANLHKGWTDMLDNNNTNELTQYFLPEYTTSAVRINVENIPSVQRSNNTNFEENLNELMLQDDVTLSFGQTKFLYTEVKDKFFVTNYRTKLRVYRNNKQIQTTSLVTLLAGENRGGWKVGNYNWVTFNYD